MQPCNSTLMAVMTIPLRRSSSITIDRSRSATASASGLVRLIYTGTGTPPMPVGEGRPVGLRLERGLDYPARTFWGPSPPSCCAGGREPRRARSTVGDDHLGLVGFDGAAVGVADGVGHATGHDGPEPLGEVGGHDAQRAEVVLAALDHRTWLDAGRAMERLSRPRPERRDSQPGHAP